MSNTIPTSPHESSQRTAPHNARIALLPGRCGAALVVLMLWLAAIASAAPTAEYFRIEAVDAATGRGVPLVELKTTWNARYLTDNAGLVAFHEPGLMGQRVFFTITSHGYEFRKDGFGFAGVALEVKPGGSATLKLKRVNVAERLYRVTGPGGWRDTVLLGGRAPVREPLLNAQVVGQDSVQPTLYRDQLYWFWGDTTAARHPLGNFHTTGATTVPPTRGGLDPAAGVDLRYFTNADGFVRPMARLPGEGMVWLDGVLTLPDAAGAQRLLAHYSRMKSLGERLEHGLVVWDDAKEQFEKLREFDNADHWRHPRNHALRWREDGMDWFLFLWPDRAVRVKAEWTALANPAAYETFTCLAVTHAGGKSSTNVLRHPDGGVAWAWRTNAFPLDTPTERRLVQSGQLKATEARFQLHDVDTGKPVTIHTGTVNSNAFRGCWIMIGVEQGGTSFLGEVWYAEASSPLGPWGRAKQIVTHDRYSFYNPTHHAFFDQDGGRLIYFEGTYAQTFSGREEPTPFYDYNQIMYRLDLADPRLKAAQGP